MAIGQPLSVLLVEDNAGDARLIKELLRDTPAVRLHWVESLAAALARLAGPPVDLVLLDLGLSDSQGLETVECIARDHPALPVIVLTGRDDDTLALAALTAGAQDYLVKGTIGLELLLRAMRYACERKRTEVALRRSEERFQLAVRATQDVIRDVNMATQQVWWGDGFPEMFGLVPEKVLPTLEFWRDRIHPDDREEVQSGFQGALDNGVQSWSGEYRFRRGDGSYAHVFDRLYVVRDPRGSPVRLVGAMTDITDRKRVEAQLAHLASHDPLTNLLNRRSFQTELTRHLAQAMRYGTQGALLLLDLDHFKDFNDTLGHAAGDEFLVNLAGVLRERLRATDLVARLGGDEFAILLPHTDGHQAHTVAMHLLHAVRCHAVAVGAESIGLTVSLGIVLIPDYGATVEELMAQADLALYQAKANGRNCLAVYSPDRDRPAKAEPRLGWRQCIRDAVERDRFILDAQPVLHLGENRVSQYELLLRMVDERGEIIPPGAFLGIAEQYGLIRDVDRWVVRRAIQMLAQQKRAGRDMRFEVNLSANAFADADLLPLIKDELRGASISPESLVLEVTEAAAIANLHQAPGFVRALKGLGCQFALDDFGMGFSSFSHLRYLPVDYLKIDGNFVHDLAHDPLDQHVVKAIVEVARGLGKQTIAEWVEDDKTVSLLREFGVGYAQGYYIGRPGALLQP